MTFMGYNEPQMLKLSWGLKLFPSIVEIGPQNGFFGLKRDVNVKFWFCSPEERHCPVGLSVTLVYSGQTVGWIKIKLGTEVGLGHSHIVLDGDPAPLPKRGT